MLHENNIDILCVCETWLDTGTDDKFVHIRNFNIVRCDAGRGAGVCIYVRGDLKISVIDTGMDKFDNVEDVWLNIQHKKFPSIIIGCVYRHPKALAASFTYLAEVFKTMSLRNKPIFILGDINDDQFVRGNSLSKIVRNLSLSQIIDKPTRITTNTSTLLDVVITNRRDMILKSDVSPSPFADHEMISIYVNIRKPKRKPEIRTYRCQKNYSQRTLCNLLLDESANLNNILETDDVNIQVEIFTETFNYCLNTCAPIVTKEITRPFAPWIDQELKKIISDKNQLQLILKEDRSNQILDNQFKQSKKNVERLLTNAKSSHFKNKLISSKGNIRGTWKVVGEIIPGLNCNNSNQINFEDPSGKAEEFNEYFSKIGEIAFKKSQEEIQNVNNGNIRTSDDNINDNLSSNFNFRPQPVDVNTVILIFKDLNETNACGSDGIPFKYLKHALPVLAFYITIIVNTSIVTGFYPKLWKHPYVAPYFKNGDIDDVGNYRPISLLPIISKILEKIVAKQLMSFMESNNFLSQSQHGFRTNLSTETALMKVNEFIYRNIDNQNISLMLLLDLSKAFDSVCHHFLLKKCNEMSIDQFWFEDYLRDRVQ